MPARLAVDIGGTFTDFIVYDDASGAYRSGKVPTAAIDPTEGVLNGIGALGLDLSDVSFAVHGTTIGLNTFLQRKGERVFLLVTEGTHDIYHVARGHRLQMYEVQYRKPPPLVPLQDIFEVGGRLDYAGEELEPLAEADVATIYERIETEGIRSVAVAFLFAYANPAHELRVEELLRERQPDLDISLSHRVAREWREYERMSSSALEAYIAPTVRAYLAHLEGETQERGLPGPLHVMQSNGGVLEAASARERPLQTLLSGPVGGAMAGAALGELLEAPNLISIDMGGTSFDVSLQVRGRPDVSPELELEGLPVLLPAVRIHTIGAGGGSIAYEAAGGLRVGPESAGAEPGPVCYGRGGERPTVTDANLLLGRLDPSYFLDGEMELDVDGAERAVAGLAGHFGLETLELADGILRVVNTKMAQAIRTLTVEQGIEARDFALVAFGGAGPMHAVFLAQELGIGRVVVPRFPGALSAWGMLQAPLRHDFTRMFYVASEQADLAGLRATFAELEGTARELLAAEAVSPESIQLERYADIRYTGQEHTVTVQLPDLESDAAFREELGERFHRGHDERHGHENRGASWEFVVLRLVALGLLSKAAPEAIGRGNGLVTTPEERRVVFEGVGPATTPIVKRDDLHAGDAIDGPVVVEEATATTVVPPACALGVDDYGNLIVEVAA